MREIKFRAWDKESEGMYPVSLIDWNLRRVYLEGPTKKATNYGWQNFDKVVLTQFTGLHDKNSKEIYEGDILKLMTHRAHYAGEKDKYRQEIATNGCRCGLNTNGLLSIQKEGQEEYEPQLEVIGNVHENPELIKD